MGLEWHNRHRNPDGSFRKDADSYAPIMQMHIRVPKELYKDAHRYAIEAQQEVTAYVTQALRDRIERDRQARWT